jgi:opacity protein-like surface antigen
MITPANLDVLCDIESQKRRFVMKKGVMFVSRCCIFVFLISIITIAGSEISAFGQSDWTGNVNFFLGGKTLENEWEPAEQQGEFGIEVDFRQQNWPVSIAIDLLVAAGEGNIGVLDYESRTSELNIGVRKIWDKSTHLRPFIGGGISFISGEFEWSTLRISEDDSAMGLWLGGGVYWALSEHFNLGLELKSSYAEINLGGLDVNAGGGHFGLLIGYHW